MCLFSGITTSSALVRHHLMVYLVPNRVSLQSLSWASTHINTNSAQSRQDAYTLHMGLPSFPRSGSRSLAYVQTHALKSKPQIFPEGSEVVPPLSENTKVEEWLGQRRRGVQLPAERKEINTSICKPLPETLAQRTCTYAHTQPGVNAAMHCCKFEQEGPS